MKNTLILLLTIFSIFLNAQSPVGAWERIHSSEDGTELKSIVIFSESHQSLSIIEKNTGKLIHSNGGSWKLEGNTMTEVVEFDTDNPERVGESVVFDININEEFLEIAGTDMKFSRIDNGSPGELNGAWLMSARFFDGKKSGTIGDIGTTSFFPSKNLGCYGDGGAIFTNDDNIAHIIRGIVNHGMYKRYHHDVVPISPIVPDF